MPQLIAETADILVIDKPGGLIVHSDGRTKEPSLAEWLIEGYPALAGVGEPWISPQGESVPIAGLVHRLDRSTSGVVIAARTPEMYAYLKNEFKERRVEKTYLAYVQGHMEAPEGKIVAEIMRSSEVPRRWYARPCEETDKRAAITDWKLLKRLEGASYLEVRPRTGRTHQIRVHLASIGHPIIGDPLYAGDRASSEEVLEPEGFTGDRASSEEILSAPARMYLHAASITLTLPSGERRTFEAPLPPDFPR